jgi:hypothetical protein
VVVGELVRPIVGPPRSADRLKKLAHNFNSNNRKNPNQQEQKYSIYQSINQWSKERKKESTEQRSLSSLL